MSIVALVGCSGTTFRIGGMSIPPSVPGVDVVDVVFGAVVGSVGIGIVMIVVVFFEIGDCLFTFLVVLLFSGFFPHFGNATWCGTCVGQEMVAVGGERRSRMRVFIDGGLRTVLDSRGDA